MKRHRTMMLIPVICLSLSMGHTGTSYAEELPEGEAVSDNTAPETAVSEDVIRIEDAGEIKITVDSIQRENRAAVIKAYVESCGSDIQKVEAENASAGVKRVLYQSEPGCEERCMMLSLCTKAGGRYIIHAYDTEGNYGSCEAYVGEISGRSFAEYEETAKENSREEVPFAQAVFGGHSSGGGSSISTVMNYTAASSEKNMAASFDPDKYRDWSLLKGHERSPERKAWEEPVTNEGTTGAPAQQEEVMADLSDYGVRLFRTDLLTPGTAASDREADVLPAAPDLKTVQRNDNIDSMSNDNSTMIIGIVIFIVILLLLTAALLLLKKRKGGAKKRVRVKLVGQASGKGCAPRRGQSKRASAGAAGKTLGKASGAFAAKSTVAGKSVSSEAKSASGRTAAAAAGASSAAQKAAGSTAQKKAAPKPVPLRGGVDEGIEKYARMTMDYVRSQFGIELKRVELKKYFSDRHGFECVDFTYRPAEGVMPAQFRMGLNDMDTALSNVSGVDTISFAADSATGTYRTTFYLGK